MQKLTSDDLRTAGQVWAIAAERWAASRPDSPGVADLLRKLATCYAGAAVAEDGTPPEFNFRVDLAGDRRDHLDDAVRMVKLMRGHPSTDEVADATYRAILEALDTEIERRAAEPLN